MNRVLYILSIALLLGACEKDIEIDLNRQSDKLVMYAFVYPDSALDLHFSKSQSILSVEDYEQVEKGRFQLFINDNFQGAYILPADTIWSNWKEFTFKASDSFRINAYELNGDTVMAESYIPEKVPIISLDTLSVDQSIAELQVSPMLRTKFQFQDPIGQSNYYQALVVREGWGEKAGEPYYTNEVVIYEKDDPIFSQGEQSGSLLPGLDFQGLFTDEKIDGLIYTLGIDIPKDHLFFDYYEDKIKITVYLYHHTDDYYDYFRSTILAAGYEGIYDGLPVFEPVKIHSNVSQGLGVVSGINFDSGSLVFVK
ncbi:DUF4249 domain-containing protein [Carboxylicivirga sp. M1479]|uniref:DUF4249 domain-containing protein n=1 Tax=Carboxylicivirga sp. M1479 TaxID=2594476 RepID=UPI00163D66B1|nr:DUF4249 domain-containing protein [Carboxylicivirga sp. M1479]